MQSPYLEGALQQLVATELLYQQDSPPQASYQFKHALIQDTAYASLLRRTRRHYHHEIAQVLEEQFPETKETLPELVAHHYTEAQQAEQAIPYWQQAGQRATRQSAYVESIDHLKRGLAVLSSLADTPERIQQELDLHIALGIPVKATRGLANPEVGRIYNRAYELCQQVGETPQLFPVLDGLRAFYLTRGEYQTAREFSEQNLRLAQTVQDVDLLLRAHFGLGAILVFLGEFRQSRHHTRQSLAVYDPDKHHPQAIGGDIDVKLASLAYAATCLWMLGWPIQAIAMIDEAIVFAEKVSHPLSLIWTVLWAARSYGLCGEWGIAQEHAERLIGLATERELPYWLAEGHFMRGWVLTERGQVEDGIVQMQHGLVGLEATGAALARSYYLAPLAEAYRKNGKTEEGLRVLSKSWAAMDKTGERLHEAESWRLKGELMLQKLNGEDVAEGHFHKAIESAQRQVAKSWELRAATSLARLWQKQGKAEEARDLLAPVYNWFTEGFDTKDLKDAKALLEELA